MVIQVRIVSAQSGFSFELLFGIAQKTFDPSVNKRVEKAAIEIDSDLTGFRHCRPVRQSTGAEKRNSFRPAIYRSSDCNAQGVATAKPRAHARKTIDDDRDCRQLASKQMQ